MKPIILFFLLTALAAGCAKDITRDGPGSADDSEKIDLGAHFLDEASLDATPYERRPYLTLRNEAGETFDFSMAQPAFSSGFAFSRTFDHPFIPEKKVIYTFTGDRVEYDFFNTELGMRLEIVIHPNLCSDPRLATENLVSDHLHVFIRGLVAPEQEIQEPALDLDLNNNLLCRIDQEQVRFLNEVTLLGETFYNVYASRISRASFFTEVFFNRELGLVALRSPNTFLVLES